jgi:V/A-type H+-transporting ATPase subunit I
VLVTMAKIEIIGPKKFFYPVVGSLHQLGTVHLEDMSQKDRDIIVRQMIIDEKGEQAQTDLENLVVQLDGIMSAVKPEKDTSSLLVESDYYKNVWQKETPKLIEEAEVLVNELEEKARQLANRKADLELELTTIDRYMDIVEKIKPLAKQIITLEDFDTVAFLLERKYKDTLGAIREEMASLTDNKYELVSEDVDETTTAALVIFHKEFSGPVHAFLADNVNEVRLPAELRNRPFEEVSDEMKLKRSQIPGQINDIKKQLNQLSSEWYHKIKALTSAINDRIDEIQCVPQFGETDYTFVVQGWVPYKNLAETKKQLRKRFGEKVLVTQLELSHHDLEEAPVVIQNPKWARPFEIIMKIVQPPRYGTVDPTPLLAVFFPLLFGFIVGDMGYAIIIFIIASLMKRKFKKTGMEAGEAICSIFQIGAIAAFLFGILFGEFFGNLLQVLNIIKPAILPFNIKGMVHEAGSPFVKEYGKQFIGHTTLPLGREAEYLTPFLFISLGIGFVHLTAGLVIGIINTIKEKATKHMVEKIGVLLVLVGIVTITISMMFFGGNIIAGTLIILAGVGMTFYGAGFINTIVHLIEALSNLFSYMRLIALGIAGVILAYVANLLAASFAKGGDVGGIIIGILLASLLHAINIAVAAFSPTIHTIRLNVLEFFNRFYESGGKKYKPFKVRR